MTHQDYGRVTPFKLIGLPSIQSLEDLSAATRISKGLLFRLCKFTDFFYKTYDMPKKSGGVRTIAQPNASLKHVQWWVLRNILDKLVTSDASKGFERGSGIFENAMEHVHASYILTLDIESFFPSISINRVWGVFRAVGYAPNIAAMLAGLCCFRGGLPQGGPCSPRLANLTCHRLDNRLAGYCGLRGIVYTRYADDMTFSAAQVVRLTLAKMTIRKIIQDEGFSLNEQKTRMAGPGRCRRVTGLVLTDSTIGVGRTKYRMIRAMVHNLCSRPLPPSDDDVNPYFPNDLPHLGT